MPIYLLVHIYTRSTQIFPPPPSIGSLMMKFIVRLIIVSCLSLCRVNSINYVVAPPPAAALYIYLSAICLGLVVTNATKDAVVCRRGELLAIIYHGPH